MQVPRPSTVLGALLLLAAPAAAQTLPPAAAGAQQAFLSGFATVQGGASLQVDMTPPVRQPPGRAAAVRVGAPVWRQSLPGWSALWPGIRPEDGIARVAGTPAGRLWIANLGSVVPPPAEPAAAAADGWFVAPASYVSADPVLLRDFAAGGARQAAVPVQLVWLGTEDLMAGPWGSGWRLADAPAAPAPPPDSAARLRPDLAAFANPEPTGWFAAVRDSRLSAWLADVAPPADAPPVGPPAGLASRPALVAAPLAVMAGLRARF